jgi:hypothetical protein
MQAILQGASNGYFFPVLPGVVLASSGAEGFKCPKAFSGVLERTPVCPGPAVPGLSPLGPEGSTAASSGVGGRVAGGVFFVSLMAFISNP